MVTDEEALDAHRKSRGKVEIFSKVPLSTQQELSTYYTPGVAAVSNAIKRERDAVFEYTSKSNTIAIVSDGTRILGLGDIGPEAGLPVMEGKAVLFKKFGGVDAVPICIGTKDEDEIVKFVTNIAPTFGAINIEDISSPKSFNVVRKVSERISIPVFHDDQHGTGVVTLAALLNSLKLAGKPKDSRIIINGAGSAGIGIARLLIHGGYRNLIVMDSSGALYSGREEMNEFKQEIAGSTNTRKENGTLEELAKNSDVIIGVSGKQKFDPSIVSLMAGKPILFALSNPYPEIEYEDAIKAGAFIAATGRSDTPNQVNNLSAFPGIMRGLLDVRAKQVTMGILYKAAVALAKGVGRKLSPEFVTQPMSDQRAATKLASSIAFAVAKEAVDTGVARISPDLNQLKKNTVAMLKRYNKIEKRILASPK